MSPMNQPPESLWQNLEWVHGQFGVRSHWRDRMPEEELRLVEPYLTPRKELAGDIPCPWPRHRRCGCHHRVAIYEKPVEELVAFCTCKGGECPSAYLKHEDIVEHKLNIKLFLQDLARACGFVSEMKQIEDLGNTYQVGFYNPFLGSKYKVFFLSPESPWHFRNVVEGLVARYRQSFIVITMTRLMFPPALADMMQQKEVCYLTLDELFKTGPDGLFNLAHPMERHLRWFRGQVLPEEDSKKVDSLRLPPEITWRDVLIRVIDNYIISLHAGSVEKVLNYDRCGMDNRRDGEPTEAWKMLVDLPNNRCVVRVKGEKEYKSLFMQIKNLSSFLKSLIPIDEEPFEQLKDKKGWKPKFKIRMR